MRLDRTPDGRIMCQICSEMKRLEELRTLSDGERQDVCQDCAEAEQLERKGGRRWNEIAGIERRSR